MDILNSPMFLFLAEYAYQPLLIYTAVCLFMLLGSFGLPIPEEVVVLSLGVLAFMARNPDLFPPPEPGLTGIEPIEAAIVCFLAVIVSDFIVYFLGKIYGPKLLKIRLVARLIKPEAMKKIEAWTAKYGMWAAGLFRFTPGLRFPGFWACGMAGLSTWKFLLVDGFAAMISVPTQILLVAHYGQDIIDFLQKAKLFLFAGIGLFLIYWLFKKWLARKKTANVV